MRRHTRSIPMFLLALAVMAAITIGHVWRLAASAGRDPQWVSAAVLKPGLYLSDKVRLEDDETFLIRSQSLKVVLENIRLQGWTFKEWMGSGYIFEKSSGDLLLTTQQLIGFFKVIHFKSEPVRI